MVALFRNAQEIEEVHINYIFQTPSRESSTDFVEIPSSQTALVGSTVSFHCQHLAGDVAMRINGTSTKDFPSASTSSEGGLHTLTITEPSLEFNETEVRCIAHLNGSSELTMPATLLLQGWCSCT